MDFNEKTRLALPETPGVYIYRNVVGDVIYVGKAKNLKKRVTQYMRRDDAVGPKTNALVLEIADIEVKKTLTEFDAILLEAKLIRSYWPKYNILAKDDKSPLYLVFDWRVRLPIIQFIRKHDLIHHKDVHSYGPFQSGYFLKKVLKTIRVSIPYCTEKRRAGKACFYTHIGLCNPCPSYISGLPVGSEKSRLTNAYRQNVRRIDRIFSGKIAEVIDQYRSEMEAAAKNERYEHAAECRNIIRNLTSFLTHGYDPEVYLSHDIDAASLAQTQLTQFSDQIRTFYPTLQTIKRIECYDISHTSGSETTGSMVVLHDGLPETASYRRFKVRLEHTPDDAASLAEVLTRRLKHAEWPMPDLFLIDGGKPQVAAAKKVIDASGHPRAAVIGLAKRFEELIIPSGSSFEILRLSEHHEALKLLERIRDEAHRFAITYHRKRRAKAFLPKNAN